MRRASSSNEARNALARWSPSDEAPGPPFGNRLDALAMVLGAHQPILLDELDIGLRLHSFSQSSAYGGTGRVHGKRRVLGNLGRELRRHLAQAIGFGQYVGESPRKGFLSGYAPARKKHQVRSLDANQARQGVGETETRMETDFDKIRGEARLGRSDPEIRHQRESEASADCRSLDCSNDRFLATEQPHRLGIKRVALLRAGFDSGGGTIREIGASAE